MRLKKLLVLSSAFIFTFGAAACASTSSSSQASSNTSSSASSSSVDEQTKVLNAITNAADYVWQLYREKDGTSISGDFDVVTTVAIGDYDVLVSWAIEQTSGTTDVLRIVDKDAKSKTVVTGYYDGKVTEQIVAKLVPTFTLNGTTKKFNEVTKHDGFNVNVDVLVLGDYAAWQKLGKDGDKTTPINIRGVVTAVNTSDGSIVFENEEHGYYGYKANNGAKAKVGDTIIFTGTRSDYSGQEEFASGGSYAVVSSGASVTPTDATADFKAATANSTSDTNLGAKYQNRLVTLKNCTPTKVDASKGYYYFTVDGGTTEYYVFSKTSYLKSYSTFIDNYSLALAAGRTFDYTGVTTVYNSTYTFYGIENNPDVITLNGDEITDQTYIDVISSNLKSDFGDDLTATYDKETVIDFSTYNIGTSKIEVTLTTTEGATAVVSETKVTLTPTKTGEVTNTFTIKVTKGGAEYSATLTLKTAQVIDLYASKALDYSDMKAAGLTSTTGDVAAFNVECAFGENKVNATVALTGCQLQETYKEFAVNNKNNEGGKILITAPTGYKVYKVVVDHYNFYNLTGYTGDAIDADKIVSYTQEDSTSNKNSKVASWKFNSQTALLANVSTYNNSLYSITIYLVADDVA